MKAEHRTSAHAPFDPALVREMAEDLKALEGPLLPILHAINDRFGYVDDAAIPVVADVLNLSRAEVYGTVTFYRDFRRVPPRRHVIKLCRAEACQARGAERLAREIEALAADPAADSRVGWDDVTVEPVYCLGNCALGPSALVDGKLHGRLDAATLAGLVRP